MLNANNHVFEALAARRHYGPEDLELIATMPADEFIVSHLEAMFDAESTAMPDESEVQLWIRELGKRPDADLFVGFFMSCERYLDGIR
jgi:hypothetical protein